MESNILNDSIIINGKDFSDLNGFYEEISKKLLKDEDWKVGTLDGLNDILYGFSGDFIWKKSRNSSEDLGFEATLDFLENKLKIGKPYNLKLIFKQKEDLLSGNGQTLFEIIVDIINSHPKINLILD